MPATLHDRGQGPLLPSLLAEDSGEVQRHVIASWPASAIGISRSRIRQAQTRGREALSCRDADLFRAQIDELGAVMKLASSLHWAGVGGEARLFFLSFTRWL